MTEHKAKMVYGSLFLLSLFFLYATLAIKY
ncbi:hypothetical protein SAMN05421743_12174 [Thalassobacillus cyri]|uniref:Uncharacterized protein n=1 Tax=Thalassobacillus cyri TaxID=571932 RepID=A0A1H4H2G5_9BACI|nr:hypothetical protein SAMN05421743_12174 [Thalassobacillus cyri]